MLNPALRKSVETKCPEVDPVTRETFFTRMDPEYFMLFSPEVIAKHIQISARLNSQRPVECQIESKGKGKFDVIVIGYDYLSEFSVLCGHLTSFGFDIRSGNIFTFSEMESIPLRRGHRGGKRPDSRKKIVDIFHVALLEQERWDESREKVFLDGLLELVLLLSRGRLQEARDKVSRQVVEFLSRRGGEKEERLYPVHVTFHDHLSKKWTVMEIHSKDTPAFLYSLSNALSMRGIYIQKVVIENIHGEVHDWIYLCDVRGKKIEGKKEQERLKMTAVLIKQFTPFLVKAPDPSKALRYFDQMLDRVFSWKSSQTSLDFLKDQEGLGLLARLLGTSEFLWEDFLRMQFESLFPIVRGYKKGGLLKEKRLMHKELDQRLKGTHSYQEKRGLVNEFKDQEMFRIDMKHLLEPPDDIMEFSLALTHLAEVVLEKACQICEKQLSKEYGMPELREGGVCPFSIFGLGKFGGKEMGYASDIELLFVYGGSGQTNGKKSVENLVFFDELVQLLLAFIEARREGIFRIDLRLKPYGSAGSLASPLEMVKRYYSPEGGAAPFERQALTKLRWIAGQKKLGREVEAYRDTFVFSDQPWNLEKALHLRDRQMKELVTPGFVNVKYSAGGLIDIEYAVQYLQVMHGRECKKIRTPSTLEGLDALCQARLMSKKDSNKLKQAYLFLRSLIDGLRIVRGNAQDLVLPQWNTDEFKFLARRLGHTKADWEKGAKKLNELIQFHMGNAHQFFEARFKRA